MPPTAQTRVFAILGDPVSHALSPLMQNAAIKAAGLDAVYVALRCKPTMLPGLLTGLAHAGGGGNVTIPHKGLALAALDVPSPTVRATRACNTFFLRRGRIHGENTDVAGFSTAAATLIDVRGAHALVVGAGGAARAAVYALLQDGCARVTVLGRTRARETQIREVAGRSAKRVDYTTDARALHDEGFDLVVNATPLGLKSRDRLPLKLDRIGGVRALFDMVYKPGGTAWVAYARSLGIPAIDGSEMLVQQGAAAFSLWFDRDAPLLVMRKAIAGQAS